MQARWAYVALLFVGCGSNPGSVDGGSDAGEERDAGSLDAGLDAGEEGDAGPIEPPALAVTCDDVIDAVYAAVPDGAADPMAARGNILACAYEAHLGASEVAARLTASDVDGVPAAYGTHVLRVAFQTTRGDGSAAASSALVFLPDEFARSPSPMLVAAHGTAGLADVCALSRYETASDALALPWAASGWPVIAPDYAGLGTAGLQGYGDNDDTARSQLDAARALRALLPAASLSDQIVMTGHSQGGGVVLSAQALGSSYGAGGALVLVLPFAPGWPTERSVNGYRFPNLSSTFGGGAAAAIAALHLYAWHGNTFGLARAGDGFAAANRTDLVGAIDTLCIFDLVTAVPMIAPTFGEIVDETLRTGLIACADGGACTGNAQLFWDFMAANILTPDPAGARVVIHTGSADTIATPESVACVAAHLVAAGVQPTVCVDGSTHSSVVAANAASVIAQAEAALSGAPPPACATTLTLPACP